MLISLGFASCFKYKKDKRSKEINFSKKNGFFELRDFFILWSTQSISQLGSSITLIRGWLTISESGA